MQRVVWTLWRGWLVSLVAATFVLVGVPRVERAFGDDKKADASGETTAKSDQTEAERQQKLMQDQYEAEQRALEKQLREDPTWQPSHVEIGVIHVGDAPKEDFVQSFCLDPDENVLVGCGGARQVRVMTDGGVEVKTETDPTELRLYTPEGKLLKTMKVATEPQAICMLRDGTIFVGGDGKLLKLDADGKQLAEANLPSLIEEKPAKAEAKAGRQKADKKSEDKETGDEKAGENTDTPKADLDAAQKAAMDRYRRAVTGIAATDTELFVVSMGSKGFGYSVWRTDHDFQQPKEIITGLVGCCGQMDIQAADGELWVPENGRHRVTRYDREGEKLASFGKTDRKAADGFGGCCEPKNLAIGRGGDIFTAESGEPVVVKRFSAEGKFQNVVAIPKYKTGCVHVCVAASQDGRIFILDPGASAIHVFADHRKIPTHEIARRIAMADVNCSGTLNSFCLDRKGNILAAVSGSGPMLGAVTNSTTTYALSSVDPTTLSPGTTIATTTATFTITGIQSESGLSALTPSGTGTLYVGRPITLTGSAAATPDRVTFVTVDSIALKTDSSPGSILVISPAGKPVKSYPLGFAAQAINRAQDGTIYAGGNGKMAHLDADGKLLKEATLPSDIKPMAPQDRKKLRDEFKKLQGDYQKVVDKYKESIEAATKLPDEIEKAEADSDEAKTNAERTAIAERIKKLETRQKKGNEEVQKARDELEPTIEAMQTIQSQLGAVGVQGTVTGIAATERDLFVCRMPDRGYGYEVWRTDHDFGHPQKIITGLSGCCGQMDVEAAGDELWIPENGRHQVHRYDRDGKVLATFGKNDRSAPDGFGGCCEPKNIRVVGDEVYTAESTQPVQIKHFAKDGTFLGFVAVPSYKTGCVRVCVEVSADKKQVFCMSPGENAIYVFEKGASAGAKAADPKSGETGEKCGDDCKCKEKEATK